MTNEFNKLLRLGLFVVCAYLILNYGMTCDTTITPLTLLTITFIIIDTYFPRIDFV